MSDSVRPEDCVVILDGERPWEEGIRPGDPVYPLDVRPLHPGPSAARLYDEGYVLVHPVILGRLLGYDPVARAWAENNWPDRPGPVLADLPRPVFGDPPGWPATRVVAVPPDRAAAVLADLDRITLREAAPARPGLPPREWDASHQLVTVPLVPGGPVTVQIHCYGLESAEETVLWRPYPLPGGARLCCRRQTAAPLARTLPAWAGVRPTAPFSTASSSPSAAGRTTPPSPRLSS